MASRIGILVFLSLVPLSAGVAQGVPPEIPLTDRVDVGARALGMGGAYSAVADDATALFYNPAALARVERIELSFTLRNHRVTETTRYLRSEASHTVSPSRISQLGFVYPFPTYRGSFVVGMGYHRFATLDHDYERRGTGAGILQEVERIYEKGSLGMWTAGLAWDASPRVSLGVSGSILTGDSYRRRDYVYDDVSGFYETSHVVDDVDIKGITGSLGALVRLGRHGRLSLVVDLPRSIDLEGRSTEDILRWDGGPDTLDVLDDYLFEDHMDLPFSTTLGLAWRFGPLLLSSDFQYTDWTQIDYDGPLRTAQGEFAYREVLAVRIGAEFTTPQVPLRVRAGFSRDPLPYRLVLTDVFAGVAEVAEFSPERLAWSVGVGALVEESVTLEAAYSHRWLERSGSAVVEKRREDLLALSAAFRF
jgi:hypothetical protein